MKTLRAIFFIAACAISTWTSAEYHRSKAALRAFVKQQACPATGEHRLPCPGYVIDHIKALACGGADAPSNMQWQTRADAKAKDKWERKGCNSQEEPAPAPPGQLGHALFDLDPEGGKAQLQRIQQSIDQQRNQGR